MKSIKILSKKQAISYSYKADMDDCVIVSITDIEEKYAKFNRTHKIKDILRLQFNDVCEEENKSEYMSDLDAERIVDFVERWKSKVNTIIIHCHAGISRSSAIACGISMYLNGTDIPIWKSGNYNPNIHCYKLMLKKYGIFLSEKEIEMKYRLIKK